MVVECGFLKEREEFKVCEWRFRIVSDYIFSILKWIFWIGIDRIMVIKINFLKYS